ncbi:Imm50 family immunity protein [Streptomyces sp. NPDC091219]|uniref:Imm50 family immunity protein n=1 Tax=Streptomyces sp. NPDC091219 TaxID=3155193 RepID=UPI00344F6F97
MTVEDFIANPEVLRTLYEGDLPRLEVDIRVRSVNLDWHGPTVTLRVDLPSFPPDRPTWMTADCNRIQCHLQFLAAEGISIPEWNQPVTARLEAVPQDGRKRIRVTISGTGADLTFTCSDSVLVGRISAFAINQDGSDDGPRSFLGRIDARRHESLPEPYEKTYYGRL